MAEMKTAAAPQKKRKKELVEVRIKEGEKGGHVVSHRYEGGDEPWQSNEEEHIFGKEDGEKLIGHLKKHMHIKGAPKEETLEGEHSGPKKEMKQHSKKEESRDEEEESAQGEEDGDK